MFEKELNALQKQGLLRGLVARSSTQGPVITISGRRYSNFGSNDYLGLASHPELIKAVQGAVQKYGAGAGSSRLLAGGTVLHRQLERAVAAFKGTGSALLFNSGYSANTGMLAAIAGEGDDIFSDELNHASIIDGCRLSRATKHIYRHKDVKGLETLLKKTKGGGKKVVVTDTVFSMDGDIAPLPAICSVCRKYGALLYIDDAHGTGVLGRGRGALAQFGITPEPWIIQMGTFSKALGSFGAFAAGDRNMIHWLVNSARSVIFSTALPPSVIAPSLAALRLVRKDSSRLARLWENRTALSEGLRELGFDLMESETPVIPVKMPSVREAMRVSAHLFEDGIYAPAIRPPTVSGPRIRLTVTAGHTDRQIIKLLGVLRESGR